jgi:hypothetical protein
LRRTRTAEEVYYNILRIQNTGQMIYSEDTALDGKIWVLGAPDSRDANGLMGYAPDSETGLMAAYRSKGWLNTPDTTPQGIWWLLHGARWSGSAAGGASTLKRCYEDFWKQNNAGGLADPLCNALTPGYIPQLSEVAYASYLLDAAPSVAADIFYFPRFTLRDGDP